MDFRSLQSLMRSFSEAGHTFHHKPGSVSFGIFDYPSIGHTLETYNPRGTDPQTPNATASSYVPIQQHGEEEDGWEFMHNLPPILAKGSTYATYHPGRKNWHIHPTEGDVLMPARTVRGTHGNEEVHDFYMSGHLGRLLNKMRGLDLISGAHTFDNALTEAQKTASKGGIYQIFPTHINDEADSDPTKLLERLPGLVKPFDTRGAMWRLLGDHHLKNNDMSFDDMANHVFLHHIQGGGVSPGNSRAYHVQTERLYPLS